ncbi:hypothetical protein I6I79_00585 [Enterococcus casseliflavus]|uniref:hypothetical protein n=1 Tax=Enterococcus casseliflavus TaxID=37734 RepID=UPI001919EB7B|nr:hypothetical protein [Enterococcus casseliflavus]QQU18188.1 hypothetical protein I6I79_00585 [Enterococcus casseliflavus]
MAMTVAVLGTTAFVLIMFVCVVIGKATDKREEELMGKTKSKIKKKKRKLLEKAKANGTINKKVLGKTLKSLIIDEEHQYASHFDK